MPAAFSGRAAEWRDDRRCPLDMAARFQVYESREIALAAGDMDSDHAERFYARTSGG